MTPQRSFRFPGTGYPGGRPQFFALRYLRHILREGVLVKLPPEALALLTKVVLEEDRRRYQAPATLFNDDLTSALGCSRDTVRRTRDALVKAGLLHYERSADRGAGVYWVIEASWWEPIHRTNDEYGENYQRTSAPVTAQVTAPVTAPPSYPIEDLSPPPSAPDPWEAVVEGLRKLGTLSPAGSAADARRNGFTPELALACIEFVLQPDNRTALGPGAVVKRFRNPEANRWPASQNWPPVSSQAQLLRVREREAERAAQARQAEAAKAAEVSTLRKRQEQLLLKWGDEIDRLTPDQRVELVRDKGPAIVREVTRQPDWRANAFIRGPLLEAFAARYGSN